MIEVQGIDAAITLMNEVRDLVNDTHAFVWAVYRSLILLGVTVAFCCMATLWNLWMLHKVGTLMHEIVKLLDKLIDKETR